MADTHETIAIKQLDSDDEVHRCAELMVHSEPWITLQRTYEAAARILKDPLREVYVVVVENELVGFIILQMKGAFIGYIQTVAVMPKWRNQGIGSKLIAFAEDRIFRETPNVFMCVSSFNPHAQRLYQRLGYEIIGELKDYIVAGHSELLLRKTIGPIREFSYRTTQTTMEPGNPHSGGE